MLSWWWTGRPGMLQFMGSQRVGHNWATELKWPELKWPELNWRSCEISIILTVYISEGIWIAQISYFMTVTARIVAQVSSQHFPHGTVFIQSKLHIRVVLCVTRYSLGLCDMKCYSVNGSHASQGGIPMKRMSQIKKAHFSLTLMCATSHHCCS